MRKEKFAIDAVGEKFYKDDYLQAKHAPTIFHVLRIANPNDAKAMVVPANRVVWITPSLYRKISEQEAMFRLLKGDLEPYDDQG
jgi:hypothetical protein